MGGDVCPRVPDILATPLTTKQYRAARSNWGGGQLVVAK